MNKPSRLPAVLAYLIPVFGWLYVLFFQRKNSLAVYHLRQSIGLFVFMLVALVSWAVVGWLLAWIPYMGVLSIALFSIVIVAYFCALVIWIMGLNNAFFARQTPLPFFGQWVSRLPIQ